MNEYSKRNDRRKIREKRTLCNFLVIHELQLAFNLLICTKFNLIETWVRNSFDSISFILKAIVTRGRKTKASNIQFVCTYENEETTIKSKAKSKNDYIKFFEKFQRRKKNNFPYLSWGIIDWRKNKTGLAICATTEMPTLQKQSSHYYIRPTIPATTTHLLRWKTISVAAIARQPFVLAIQ